MQHYVIMLKGLPPYQGRFPVYNQHYPVYRIVRGVWPDPDSVIIVVSSKLFYKVQKIDFTPLIIS